jgi:hypothetical protein
MSEERKDLKEKVTDVTEKAAEIASDVRDKSKAKGEKALDRPRVFAPHAPRAGGLARRHAGRRTP